MRDIYGEKDRHQEARVFLMRSFRAHDLCDGRPALAGVPGGQGGKSWPQGLRPLRRCGMMQGKHCEGRYCGKTRSQQNKNFVDLRGGAIGENRVFTHPRPAGCDLDYRSESPPILRDFLVYHETIQGHSPKTVDEYFLDLRSFFRYLKLENGSSPRIRPWNRSPSMMWTSNSSAPSL